MLATVRMNELIEAWNAFVDSNEQDSENARDLLQYVERFFYEYANDNAYIGREVGTVGDKTEYAFDEEVVRAFESFIFAFQDVPGMKEALNRFARDIDIYMPTPQQGDDAAYASTDTGDTPPPENNDDDFSDDDGNGENNPPAESVRERPDYDARKQWMHSDNNQYMLDREAAAVYFDMGIISEADYNKSSPEETIKVLGRIPDLEGGQRTEFSERFIDRIVENEELFRLAPPMALAEAYNGTKERIRNGEGDRDALMIRRDRLAARIDQLSADFDANTGFHFCDPTNFADVDEGYNYMFNMRLADLDSARDWRKIQEIYRNIEKLKRFGNEYDGVYRITDLAPEDAEALEPRWVDLSRRIARAKVSDETLELAGKYRFNGADGNPIPQFVDSRGRKFADWDPKRRIDPKGRLGNIIRLARHDVALRNAGDIENTATDKELEEELNRQIPYELFEIDIADRILEGAGEDPKRFTNPNNFEKFIDELRAGGGEISDAGYQAALDAKVNQTAGFAMRVKQKLKDGAKKAGGFFGKLFKPIADIDKRADDRFEGGPTRADKRKKRIEFFIRILKGAGSAFLVSAAITTIATAAAALAGVGVAVAIASIGIVTGITMSALQIHKWRKAQRAAGKDDGIRALLKDKRMLATLGTTAIAAIAMIFGVAGFSMAAVALGYGAMALGTGQNAVQMFNDAKAAGMGTAESVAWVIASTAAIIGSGIGGRFAAKGAIDAYNRANPENTVFQNKSSVKGTASVSQNVTYNAYDQDALDNAKRIAESWYRDDLPELQRRVGLINQHNAQNGTTIDPYRAVMLNADAGGQTFDNMALHANGGGVTYSGGNHNVIDTAAWRAQYGFGADETGALRDMFAGGGLDPKGMDVVARIDPMVSANNEVGRVGFGNAPHNDGYLWQNSTDYNNVHGGGTGASTFDTYEKGPSVFHSTKGTITELVDVDKTIYTSDVPVGLGMFGTYGKKTEKYFKGLKKRIGALLDKIRGKQESREEEQPKRFELGGDGGAGRTNTLNGLGVIGRYEETDKPLEPLVEESEDSGKGEEPGGDTGEPLEHLMPKEEEDFVPEEDEDSGKGEESGEDTDEPLEPLAEESEDSGKGEEPGGDAAETPESHKEQEQARRMTKEEIDALLEGVGGNSDESTSFDLYSENEGGEKDDPNTGRNVANHGKPPRKTGGLKKAKKLLQKTNAKSGSKRSRKFESLLRKKDAKSKAEKFRSGAKNIEALENIIRSQIGENTSDEEVKRFANFLMVSIQNFKSPELTEV